MSFIAMALLTAYATQPGSVANDVSRTLAADAPDAGQYLSASAAPEQVEEYVRDFFAKFDRDGSGFIERSEGPRQIDLTCCGASGDQTARQGDVLTGEAAWRRFLSDNGDDGDDRISFAEFRNARYEQLLRDGIPVRREDVAMVGNRPSPYAERQPGGTQGRIYSEELDYVEASPERVRAYVRRMFDNWDTDKSGFVELAEAPSSLITQQARMGANGKATYDPDDPPKELLGHAARQQYVANVDKDNDGKVSFEEFAEPVMPQFLQRGIPLIPADWTPSPPTRD